MSIFRPRQQGMTILEVLVALSIFAVIGVSSFRILTAVIATDESALDHSRALGQLQKAMLIIDRDIQQVAKRDIRSGDSKPTSFLTLIQGGKGLEFTRSGWRNPLMLSRSSLQRVGYNLGTHPHSTIETSVYYRDKTQYLLRYYWSDLDRDDRSKPYVQALLANVKSLTFAVVSDQGRHLQWPIPENSRNDADSDEPEIIAVELLLEHASMGLLNRLYRVF